MSSENNSSHTYDGIQEDREQKPPVYFNLLFYGLIIWGVIFSAYFLLSGWSSHDEFQQKMATHQQKTAISISTPVPANR
jgi:cytochrome c oxidase cbb3-type subunit 3